MGLRSAVKKVKGALLRREVMEMLEPIDTEEERLKMANEQVKRGVSRTTAAMYVILTTSLVEAIRQVDFGAIMSGEWKSALIVLVSAFFTAVAVNMRKPGAFTIQEDATPEQVGATVAKVAEVSPNINPAAPPKAVGVAVTETLK